MNPELQKEINEVQETIGPQADLLIDARLTGLMDSDLEQFLKRLTVNEKEKFFEALRRFRYYAGLLGDVWDERLGSNFLVVVLFALIEFVMGKESYKPLPNFLEEKLSVSDSCGKNSVQSWLKEWRIQYGSVNNVQRFFEENLKDFEKELLDYVRQCEGWENCDTIPKFAKQLAEFRHHFVHSLSTEQIWPWDKRFLTVKNGALQKLDTPVRVLSMPFVTRIILIGVLRKFGYQGNF